MGDYNQEQFGKLAVTLPIADFFTKHVEGNGFEMLAIWRAHLNTVHTLPFHHRDPFDRLLIAQSISEAMTFATGDGEAAKYAVALLWQP